MAQINYWRHGEIKTTIRKTFKLEFDRTNDAVESSNRTIDAVFQRHGNLSEQELNVVRTQLARKIDQYTKQFETIGK